MVNVDPITFEVVRSQLDGIVREMQIAMYRTGYSTLIRETHDMSCGIVDREGRVVAQHASIPIHLGSYPACIEGLLGFYGYDEIEEGDCFFVNHPYYSGCAHSLDSAAITPIFFEGELVAFGIGITHKGDIGGLTPGSRQVDARDIFGEGTLVPPVKYKSRGRVVQETDVLIRANSRTPELLLGDYNSQAGPESSIGGRRIRELMSRYGKETVLGVFDMVGDKTEQYLRAEISKWKDGVYEAEAYLDNDMVDMETPIRFHVRLIKEDDHITLDFFQSPDQNRGPVNCRPPIITGSCLYAILSMMDDPPANNHGVGRVIEYALRPGSVFNPVYPAPVSLYSYVLATLEDMVMDALVEASGRPPRAHHGARGNVTIGSRRPGGRTTLQYEITPGGGGAFMGGDGWSGCGFSGTGPKIACVEVLETEYPIRMQQFTLVRDSGGVGEYRGGLAYVRDYEILQDGTYSGGGMRYMVAPPGAAGGGDGAVGSLVVNPGAPIEQRYRSHVSNVALETGYLLRLQTGSGGGVGDPKNRDRDRVADDLLDGYISPEAAHEVYGLSEQEAQAALLGWGRPVATQEDSS